MVERPEKYGGTVRFATYKELAEAYEKEEIYPLDLKNAVARELNHVCTLFVLLGGLLLASIIHNYSYWSQLGTSFQLILSFSAYEGWPILKKVSYSLSTRCTVLPYRVSPDLSRG